MSTLTNLPVVNTESEFSKSNRMVMVIAIIILLVYYASSQKKKLTLITYNESIEHMSDSLDIAMFDEKPIIGKYIQVINNNKKILPIHKIIIIDINKKVIPIFTKNAKNEQTNKQSLTSWHSKFVILNAELPKIQSQIVGF